MNKNLLILVAVLVAPSFAWAQAPATAPPALGPAEQAAIKSEYSKMFADPEFRRQLDGVLNDRFADQNKKVDEKLNDFKTKQIPAAVAAAMKAERDGIAGAAREAVLQAVKSAAPKQVVAGAALGGLRGDVVDPSQTWERHVGTGAQFLPKPVGGFQPCPVCGSTSACNTGRRVGGGYSEAPLSRPRQAVSSVISMFGPSQTSSCSSCSRNGNCSSCQQSQWGY